MAKKSELTGQYSGLLGEVVLSSWNGIQYMRSRGTRTKKKPTIGQLMHQVRMALVSKFIYSMDELLDESFKNYAIRKTGPNAAFSYNFKNAITGAYPDFRLDYAGVLVSRGDLPAVPSAKVELGPDGQLHYSWSDNSGTGMARPDDRCMLVAHFPEHNRTYFKMGVGARSEGKAVLDIAAYREKEAEAWLAFMSADGREVSNSVYTGHIVLQ